MPVVIGLFLIVIVILVVLAKSGLLAKSGIGSKSEPKLPYRKKEYLLTKAERAFYEVLQQCISDDHVVFSKVRLLDLVCLPKGTENAQSFQNRVQSKHVDFVVCSRSTLTPILVLELNDRSHERTKTRERDSLVEQVFTSAGLPLLMISARATYDTRELTEQIQRASQA
jgi:hypothetical protein